MKIIRPLLSFLSFCFCISLSAKNWADVNGDETVNISDVVAVINTISGNKSFMDTADVNCDGNVNISDVVAVVNIMAGQETDMDDPAVAAGFCPNSHHPHFINMGDGRKWSCCNVGATAPWEFGGHYAWGETEEDTWYGWSAYQHCDGSEESCYDLGKDISRTIHDVAYVKWGDRWCMPNLSQAEYLGRNCINEVFKLNGIKGRKVTSKNGAVIFLPGAGEKQDGYYFTEGESGSYWTSTVCDTVPGYAYEFWFEFDNVITWNNDFDRCYGQSVRPVAYEEPDAAVKAGLCPDNHHPHVIDLGFGVSFSCCNVGADAPWEIGGYYAWAETTEKSSYDVDNYSLYNSSEGVFPVPRIGVTGNRFDVSYATWGGNWYMPDNTQLSKLANYCSSEWTELNGVSGRKFTASNGSSVFLPATGYRSGESIEGSAVGYYWTTKYAPSRTGSDAEALQVSESNVVLHTMKRYYGLCARPVFEAPDAAVRAMFCPDNHHPHAIDLGNGYEIACCNVDADAPWEAGGFYSWGETETKSDYFWTEYKFSESENDLQFTYLGADIAGTDYDVAHVKWGGDWVMPNRELAVFLENNCRFEDYEDYCYLNGVHGGVLFTKVGKKVFLTEAGSPGDDPTIRAGRGRFWTSTCRESDHNDAYMIYVDRDLSCDTDTRNFGMNIRPVRKKK